MNERCKHVKEDGFHCGSYAFNLYKEDIDQGSYCDHHYWQDQVQKARADEREACAVIGDSMDPLQDGAIGKAIRERSNT